MGYNVLTADSTCFFVENTLFSFVVLFLISFILLIFQYCNYLRIKILLFVIKCVKDYEFNKKEALHHFQNENDFHQVEENKLTIKPKPIILHRRTFQTPTL